MITADLCPRKLPGWASLVGLRAMTKSASDVHHQHMAAQWRRHVSTNCYPGRGIGVGSSIGQFNVSPVGGGVNLFATCFHEHCAKRHDCAAITVAAPQLPKYEVSPKMYADHASLVSQRVCHLHRGPVSLLRCLSDTRFWTYVAPGGASNDPCEPRSFEARSRSSRKIIEAFR